MAKKSENIFVKAKAYQKAHPRTSWAECIQKCKGKKTCVGAAKKRKAPVRKIAAVSGVRKRHKVKAVRVATTGRKAETHEQKARKIIRAIESLELKRRQEKLREMKDILQLQINAYHDKLDHIKKQLRAK